MISRVEQVVYKTKLDYAVAGCPLWAYFRKYIFLYF